MKDCCILIFLNIFKILSFLFFYLSIFLYFLFIFFVIVRETSFKNSIFFRNRSPCTIYDLDVWRMIMKDCCILVFLKYS